jgi:DNA-binding CsgD family transcriptional regulator
MNNRTEEIRRMKSEGMSLQQIGDIFNISRERVRQIVGISEEEKKKIRARTKARSIVKLGLVSKQPCRECGNPNTEAHHEDYDRPHGIIWLCRKHHDTLHHPNKDKKS